MPNLHSYFATAKNYARAAFVKSTLTGLDCISATFLALSIFRRVQRDPDQPNAGLITIDSLLTLAIGAILALPKILNALEYHEVLVAAIPAAAPIQNQQAASPHIPYPCQAFVISALGLSRTGG